MNDDTRKVKLFTSLKNFFISIIILIVSYFTPFPQGFFSFIKIILIISSGFYFFISLVLVLMRIIMYPFQKNENNMEVNIIEKDSHIQSIVIFTTIFVCIFILFLVFILVAMS